MINFENVFPILLWSVLGFLILKAIMVSIMASWVDWEAATWIGWGIGAWTPPNATPGRLRWQ